MANDQIRKYIWLVDTLRKYGKITHERIDELWLKSPYSFGRRLPRRTFFHLRRAVEDNFNLEICCDAAGRYYLKDYDTDRSHTYVDWMLDSFAINSALSDAGDAQERIEVEPVPSARDFLAPAIQAMREGNVVSFSYSGFNRSRTEHNIILRPYFLKRYKQRWYMVGISEKKQDIRTYALDRMSNLQLLERKFEMPQDLSADEIFGEIVGITSSKGKTRQIRLQTTTTQAKYLRALPLHPSQREELHDQYSIFTYNLKINWELCHEILGMGAEVKVLEPPELKAMVVEDLKRCLGQYQNID